MRGDEAQRRLEWILGKLTVCRHECPEWAGCVVPVDKKEALASRAWLFFTFLHIVCGDPVLFRKDGRRRRAPTNAAAVGVMTHVALAGVGLQVGLDIVRR